MKDKMIVDDVQRINMNSADQKQIEHKDFIKSLPRICG